MPTLNISWMTLHDHASALAGLLARQGPWRGIVAVSRGGLVPAAIVARALDIRLVEAVAIASYDDRVRGDVQVLNATPRDAAGWLIIDDLADTGATARVVLALRPQAHYAVLYAKPRGQPFVDTFFSAVAQDVWIEFPWDQAPPIVK